MSTPNRASWPYTVAAAFVEPNLKRTIRTDRFKGHARSRPLAVNSPSQPEGMSIGPLGWRHAAATPRATEKPKPPPLDIKPTMDRLSKCLRRNARDLLERSPFRLRLNAQASGVETPSYRLSYSQRLDPVRQESHERFSWMLVKRPRMLWLLTAFQIGNPERNCNPPTVAV